MNAGLFDDFLSSGDTLRVYDKEKLIFSSERDRLLPLLEYLETTAAGYNRVVVMDRVMGNAAALLSIRGGCGEVFSPLGSQLAVETLDRFGIKHNIAEIIPRIMKPDGSDMCPMEKLSMDKSPEEFYEVMKARISRY